jgi:tRNA (cytosine34-C5)-methyltransferase
MRRRRAFKSRGEGDGTADAPARKNADATWTTSDFKNELLEKFYRGNVVPESEWEAFIETMRSPLSTSVRFASDPRVSAATLEARVASFADALQRTLGSARALRFVPLAVDMPVGRGALKKLPQNRGAKDAINALSDAGFLSRQEIVSMVPPLLLDVQPGHRVLDMCAAPGSKTMQMLERLVAPPAASGGDAGCVVANDMNAGRLDVLQRQASRNGAAAAHLVVTNFDARHFPLDTAGRFDRVLCDTMCSGDGTLRKSADLWSRWRPTDGPALHLQQRNVLWRGMQLCRAGGIVVFSTCSLNPVEDEAVVAACLARADGRFELIDPRATLPHLLYKPGLRDWRVMAADGSWADSPAAPTPVADAAAPSSGGAAASVAVAPSDVPPATAPTAAAPAAAATSGARAQHNPRDKLQASMFPDFAARGARNIEFCCRVLPHMQDTGGFFIAAMRCVSALTLPGASAAGAAGPAVASADADGGATFPARAPRRNASPDAGFGPLADANVKEVQRALHLLDAFPFANLVARKALSREPKAFFVADGAVSAMRALGSADPDKILAVGVRCIEASSRMCFATCRFAVEGAAVMAQHAPHLVFRVPADLVLQRAQSASATAATAAAGATSSAAPATAGATAAPVSVTTIVRVPLDTAWLAGARAASAAGIAAASDLPPLRHAIAAIELGPHAPTDQPLFVPADIDAALGVASLRMLTTHLTLLTFAARGFDGVCAAAAAAASRDGAAAANGGSSGAAVGDDDDDDDDDDEDGDEADPGAAKPPMP